MLFASACNPEPKPGSEAEASKTDAADANQTAAARSKTKNRTKPGRVPPPTASSGSKGKVWPVVRTDRDFQEVHPSIAKAWFLVENSYFVIDDQLQSANRLLASSDPAEVKRGTALKQAASKSVQERLFAVNPSIEALFKEALKDEPKNPLNLVAYAVYLKPRRDYSQGKSGEKLIEALKLMDQAIELWPDESSFYYIKAQMLVTSQLAYNFARNTPEEEAVIADQWPVVRELLTKAERYDPLNAQINYYRAELASRFSPLRGSPEANQEVLREIHRGNEKSIGAFVFPPPLPPYAGVATMPAITVSTQSAVYYDHWQHYGWSDLFGLDKLTDVLSKELRWKKDKQAIADVMFMYYAIGRVKPLERTYFSYQQTFLEGLLAQPGLDQAEKTQISGLLLRLSEYYSRLCSRFMAEGIPVDPREYNAVGIKQLEMGMTRNNKLREMVQPVQAAFLKEAGAAMSVELPLDKDPARWAE